VPCDWGLWHQIHLSGHPFMNTVVLIPGPSSADDLDIEKISPLVSDSLGILLASADLKLLVIRWQIYKVGFITPNPYL
jgi:hypothetical protein